MKKTLKLHNYFRSSASYRVRIALHIKGLDFVYSPVHLVNNGGEQNTSAYKSLNPLSQVPCLEHGDHIIAQSVAIIQYLDDVFPESLLIPQDPYQKALAWQFCEIINSGIQPLHNLSVTGRLEKMFSATPEQKNQWMHHFMEKGFDALEAFLKIHAKNFCMGKNPSVADCFLIPQIFASKRFGFDPTKYETCMRIYKSATELAAFKKAAPENQIDAS